MGTDGKDCGHRCEIILLESSGADRVSEDAGMEHEAIQTKTLGH